MKLAPAQLERMAAETGFQAEPLEKVLHLLGLLEALRNHPFLGDRLVLKGGTAINLFVLDLARLSVDVDLNYIGAVDRKTMLAERPKVEKAVQAVCRRQGLTTRRVPASMREVSGGSAMSERLEVRAPSSATTHWLDGRLRKLQLFTKSRKGQHRDLSS